MRVRMILLTLAVASLTARAAAQNIQREVDVTRAYEPSVQNALKLNIMPDMADTAQMRPEFNYEITPRPLSYGFAVNPLTAARLAAVGRPVQLPFYAKLGAGYPLQSVADLRYAKALNERVDFGAFASHYGRYGKIENDMAVKESAFGTDNRVGAFLDFRPAEDFSIRTDLGYNFRNVTRYGYYGLPADKPYYDLSDDALKQFYHNPYAKVTMGHDFLHPGKINVRVGVGVDYFAERYKYDQFRWDLDALFGFRAGIDGLVTVGVNAGLTGGQNNLKGYKNTLVRGEIAYAYEYDGLRFRLGAGFGGSETTPGEGKEEYSKYVFLPQLTLEKDLFYGKLTPFLDLRSGITDNSYGELMKRNPYTFSGVTAPNTIGYEARAGIKGTLGSFKYKVYGGYDMLKDNFYWANVQEYSAFGNAFTALTDSLNVFRAGVELQANIVNAVTLYGAFQYSSYDSEGYEFAAGLPEIKADFGVTYNHRNRFYLTAGAGFVGERTMYEYNYSTLKTNVIPWQMDLKVGADYFVNKQFGVFLQVNNLLNHDLYEFNRYRELGINGTVGIKLSF